MKVMIAVLLLLFSGCSEKQEYKSVFDGWQPPKTTRPDQYTKLESDEVNPDKPPASAIMPKVTEPQKLVEPIVDLIVVSISKQRLWAYAGGTFQGDVYVDGQQVKEYRISTAKSGITYPLGYKGEIAEVHNHSGIFTIDRKDIDHVSGQYGSPMPYALHYHEGHWIHATEPRFYHLLGSPASHGCVRLHLDTAMWLYTHTPIGCKLLISKE